MTNLLPKEYLSSVQKERRARVLVVVFVGAFMTFFGGVFFLTPALFLSNAGAREAERVLDLTRQSIEQQQGGGILVEVRRTRGQIEALQTEFLKTQASVVLATLDEARTPAISLSSVSYTRGSEENPDRVSLSGVASTREALLSFSQSLDREDMFTNVDLPVSSLAQSTDIGFSISFDVVSSTETYPTTVDVSSSEDDETDILEPET